jgi:hypothetical protein
VPDNLVRDVQAELGDEIINVRVPDNGRRKLMTEIGNRIILIAALFRGSNMHARNILRLVEAFAESEGVRSQEFGDGTRRAPK